MIEIGSSDAPAILGVSSFLTPWQLWAEKVGLIERVDEPDEVMRAGTALQEAVLEMEVDEFGLEAGAGVPQHRATHPARKWQRATPDCVTYDDDRRARWLTEVKCLVGQPPPVPRVADVVQCLHQLLVFEQAESNRLIYFGGLRRERFIITRHQGALDRVLRAEEAFLELVEKQIPPPVRAEDAEGLWRGWPLARDEVRVLPPEAIEWDRKMVNAERMRAIADHRYQESRAQIKAAMGEAMSGVLPDGSGVRYTWRPDKRGIRALKRKGKDGANGEATQQGHDGGDGSTGDGEA